jgi:hypothetical protein
MTIIRQLTKLINPRYGDLTALERDPCSCGKPRGATPLPGPIGVLLAMADSGVPDKLLPAIRLAVFWIAVPFIGLLLGGEDFRGGNYAWTAGWIGCALISILIAVYWDNLLPARLRSKVQPLGYLRNEDSELGAAVRDMAWRSAWARWFASQFLANNNHQPAREEQIMQTASILVLDALTDGRLEARGRRAGRLDYEAIPRTHWRSTALHMIRDDAALWRMVLIPRGGAEISPEGAVTGRDASATQRTEQLAAYDSIIVSSRQFEAIWPLRDREADKARKHLLKAAKYAGADVTEIEKLSRGDVSLLRSKWIWASGALTLLFVAAVGFAAHDYLWPKSTVSAERWSALTKAEASAFESRVRSIPPEDIVVACETINCRDLADGIAKILQDTPGWKVEILHRGGMDITGRVGIVLHPKEPATEQLRDAIQSTTSLKVELLDETRAEVGGNQSFLVVGTRPF